jgi:hypothetical protein
MNFGVDSQLESLTISYAAWIFERRNSFIVLTDGLTTLIVTADRYFRTYINSCKSIFLDRFDTFPPPPPPLLEQLTLRSAVHYASSVMSIKISRYEIIS